MAQSCIDRCEEMVKQFNVDYVPGGATQNTIRIAQVRLQILIVCASYFFLKQDAQCKVLTQPGDDK